MSDSSEVVQFIVAHFCQGLNAVISQKFRCYLGLHRFVGYRFGPIFTKFEGGSMFRIRPSTAWAIKTLLLVDHSQRLDGLNRPHFGKSMSH